MASSRFGARAYAALTAWYKNSGGNIVAASGPIQRLSKVSSCRTLATCDGTADEAEAIVGYQTGSAGAASNLLPVSATRALGDASVTLTSATTYDAVGNVLTADGTVPGATDTIRYRYDPDPRRVGTILPDPDGAGPRKRRAEKVTYARDSGWTVVERGTVEGLSEADWTNFAALENGKVDVDKSGRVVIERQRVGVATHALVQHSYDALGRRECSVVRMNKARLDHTPPPACALDLEGTDGPDRIVKYSYDAAGRVAKVTTGFGTGEAREEARYSYTDGGQVALVTDAEDNRTSFVYDGHGRLYRTRYPVTAKGQLATAANDYEQLGYDAGGNVVSLKLRDNDDSDPADDPVILLGYDGLGRLTLKDLPGAEPDVGYAYDNFGQMLSASRTGHNVTFVHDALGRKRSETGPNGTMGYVYDAAGRQSRLTWPDGFYVGYGYDATGAVTTIVENEWEPTGSFPVATYGYDDLGRLASLTRGNGLVTSYAYDASTRLETLSHNIAGTTHDLTLGFGYNAAGQILTNSRSNNLYALSAAALGDVVSAANGLNQLASLGAAAPTHDGRGNMTFDGANSYSYSSENLLTGASGGKTLAYDPLLRLHRITSGAVQTSFGYDGLDMVAEYDAAGTLKHRYVHGPGADEPLVWYDGADTAKRRWAHADERGSVVAWTYTNGGLHALNRYDEYGVPASGNVGRFQYTGQAWLPEIGLYHYKARMYDPDLGRFLQPDPIGYGDGMNRYGYTGGDPVNSVDPTGLYYEGAQVTGSHIRQDGTGGLCGSCSGTTDWYNPKWHGDLPSDSSGGPGIGGSFATDTIFYRFKFDVYSDGSTGPLSLVGIRIDPGFIGNIGFVPASGYAVNLVSHEKLGGHTIGKHVRKSRAYLIGRIVNNRYNLLFFSVGLKRAGSYTSLAAATRLTNATLSANHTIVQQVIRGDLASAFLTSRFQSPTGYEAYTTGRSAPYIRATYETGVVIYHAPGTLEGFLVKTSYPRSPG